MTRILLEDTLSFTLGSHESSGKPVIQEGVGGKKLVAHGRFALADVPTANGRIYKRALWVREIARLSEAMKARRVFGEADHPCLTSNDFRVLTVEGWKPFAAIKAGDRVWSRQDGMAIASTVTAIVDQDYSGPAYRIQNKSMDSTFTPGHRLLAVKRPDGRGPSTECYITLDELASSPGKFSHHAVPRVATWFAEDISEVEIPPCLTAGRCRNDVTKPLKLDAKLFAAFMGLYLAEGHCSPDSVDNYGVFLSQKTEWSRNLIRDEVLSKFPADLKWMEEKTGFFLSDARLHAYLKPIGDCYSKHVPDECKKLGVDALKEMLFWFTIGDGRVVSTVGASTENGRSFKEENHQAVRAGDQSYTRQSVFSVSERLIRDLHECLVRSGGAGTVSKIVTETDYEFADHIIEAKNKVPLYNLNVLQSDFMWLDPRCVKVDKVEHDGRIYCLSVEHGNFYMEQNGRSFWTGNSDGRTKLTRVAHILTDLVLTEDGEILGTAEIMNTSAGKELQAIVAAGGSIGVSSRGYGSVSKNSSGTEDVEDDYQLDTFDFVVDPAQGTAYPAFHVEDKNKPEAPVINEGAKTTVTPVEPTPPAAPAAPVVEAVDTKKMIEEAVAKAKAEVRAEVESKLLSDPKVAGARAALESVKQILRPFILDKDVNVTLEEKDVKIKALEEQVAALTAKTTKAKTENVALCKAVKDLGFKFFVTKTLAGHPKIESLLTSFGDLTLVESVDALKALVEPHKAGLVQIRTEEVADGRKLIVAKDAEIKRLSEALKTTSDNNKKVVAERDAAVQTAHTASLGLYLERKIVGNPKASAIRLKFAEMKNKSKDSVDALLEAFVSAPSRSSGDFSRIRSRLAAAPRSKTLVEDSIGDTGSGMRTEGHAIQVMEGVNMDADDINRLAGIK